MADLGQVMERLGRPLLEFQTEIMRALGEWAESEQGQAVLALMEAVRNCERRRMAAAEIAEDVLEG